LEFRVDELNVAPLMKSTVHLKSE
jgi:hypothetical protein